MAAKSVEKEKLLVIRIAKESTYFVDKQLTVINTKTGGPFQLNCHLVSLIFFHTTLVH